jgi:hypothetical protein
MLEQIQILCRLINENRHLGNLGDLCAGGDLAETIDQALEQGGDEGLELLQLSVNTIQTYVDQATYLAEQRGTTNA